jgi:hypothetical protein
MKLLRVREDSNNAAAPQPVRIKPLGTGTFSSDADSACTFSNAAYSPNISIKASLTAADEGSSSKRPFLRFWKKKRLPSSAVDYESSTSITASVSYDSKALPPIVFYRNRSNFLRVSDLSDHSLSLLSALPDTGGEPHYHYMSSDPPYDGQFKTANDNDAAIEQWIALDDGCDHGQYTPMAALAVDALVNKGLAAAFCPDMWKPASTNLDDILLHGLVYPNLVNADDVRVWSGSFAGNSSFYGSDLPAVRAAGMINKSPEALANMLMDSTRVKEYNKLSVGRTDLLVLQADDDGPFGGVTKVVRSQSKPPLIRKLLQFTSILHARKLTDDSGLLLVSRAVTSQLDETATSNFLISEMILGVTILKKVKDNPNQCFVITVNQIRSPMIPMIIAKRIGLQAAANFIHDLRALP